MIRFGSRTVLARLTLPIIAILTGCVSSPHEGNKPDSARTKDQLIFVPTDKGLITVPVASGNKIDVGGNNQHLAEFTAIRYRIPGPQITDDCPLPLVNINSCKSLGSPALWRKSTPIPMFKPFTPIDGGLACRIGVCITNNKFVIARQFPMGCENCFYDITAVYYRRRVVAIILDKSSDGNGFESYYDPFFNNEIDVKQKKDFLKFIRGYQ